MSYFSMIVTIHRLFGPLNRNVSYCHGDEDSDTVFWLSTYLKPKVTWELKAKVMRKSKQNWLHGDTASLHM